VGLALVAATEQERPYDRVREHLEARVIGVMESDQTRKKTLSDLERLLWPEMLELGRQIMEEHARLLGPGRVEGGAVTGADGMRRDEPRLHERHVETVFGTIQVPRMGYGSEGSESLHPKDAALNLPEELFSHMVRRKVAEEASRGAFEEAVAAVNRGTAAKIGKRQAEGLVIKAAEDFDAFYQVRQEERANQLERPAEIVVVSTDGKGIVMRHEDLREATRKAAEKRSHKLQARLSKGEKRNAKRESTVATVYEIAPYIRTPEEVLAPKGPLREGVKERRPRPESKRVWASVAKKPKEVIGEAFAEAKGRDPDGRARLAILVDGGKEQLRHIRTHADRAKAAGVSLAIILDIYHVTEYVWKASSAFFKEDAPEREAWVRDQLLEILHGRGRRVATLMRRKATLEGLRANQRKSVDACARYLTVYKEYQNYEQYLAEGLPIGTGVIEGACRHLVKDRMDLTGARWSLAGAEAVLRLRALRSSGDFDEYWDFHEQREWERNHASLYAGGTPPRLKDESRPSQRPSQRPSLRVIK